MKAQRLQKARKKQQKARPRCKHCGRWLDLGHYAWCRHHRVDIFKFGDDK